MKSKKGIRRVGGIVMVIKMQNNEEKKSQIMREKVGRRVTIR